MPYILYAIYAILIIGPIYLVWAMTKIGKKMKKVEWQGSQEYTVLRIDVPRNNDKSPLAAEQMFAAIHGIYSESAAFQNHLSFEIVSKDKYLQFFIQVPVHLKDFVEGQVYAQYPTVEINEVDDYIKNVDFSTRSYAISELNLTKPDVYPIKQFTDFEVDPISGITSVMSKLSPGEEVWFQIVIRPIGDEWIEKGHAMVNSVRSGKKAGKKGIIGTVFSLFFLAIKTLIVQAVNPGSEAAPASEIKLPASVEEALKLIEQKITKLGFETKIRIMALGGDPVSVKFKCENVAAVFKQFNTTNLNGFKVGDIHVNDQGELKEFAYRSLEESGGVLNISELASLFHFPHSSVSTPNIVWSGSKKGEPPANLPLRENTLQEELTVIGETNFRNSFHQFGIKKDDRRRHIYIIGKSGVGKSVLIENMAKDDIVEGRGVIVVDPHGELVEKLLACIPDERINDIVVFDPSDRAFPIAFNLLEHVDDDFKGLVASGFVGIFKKIFGDSWGPRLEHILRNTVLALLDYPNSTMLDIPKMLTGNRFREKVVEQVKDPVIKDFWLNEFAQYDSKFRTEAVSPILNKVGQFLASSTIRNIVGQPKSRINIREILDQKKIMMVNLSRGKIGEDNSALLGAMMITKIQLGAMSRANVTVDNRPDSYLYVDEFQNFATDSFATILAEARKYNLNLTMAHQYIAQMPEAVRDAVFGNAGTIISFRIGGADADFLVKEYEPIFAANDMVNLDKYHIYIKLLIDGVASPAFSARTLPPLDKLTGNLEKVIEISRGKYSNPRAEVEAQIEGVSKQEAEELKKEAELYRTGGLEALLIKKSVPEPEIAKQVEVVAKESEAPKSITESKPIEENKSEVIIEKPTEEPVKPIEAEIEKAEFASLEQSAAETTKRKRPPAIRSENILDGKVYKERTARGGVKWFIGEDIDEEKLMEKGIILNEEAKRMVQLTKDDKTSVPHKSAEAIGESRPEKEESIAEEKSFSLVEKKKEEKPEREENRSIVVEGDLHPAKAEMNLATAEESPRAVEEKLKEKATEVVAPAVEIEKTAEDFVIDSKVTGQFEAKPLEEGKPEKIGQPEVM